MRNIDFKKNLELVYPTDKRRFEIYMPWVIIQRIISVPLLSFSIIVISSPKIFEIFPRLISSIIKTNLFNVLL